MEINLFVVQVSPTLFPSLCYTARGIQQRGKWIVEWNCWKYWAGATDLSFLRWILVRMSGRMSPKSVSFALFVKMIIHFPQTQHTYIQSWQRLYEFLHFLLGQCKICSSSNSEKWQIPRTTPTLSKIPFHIFLSQKLFHTYWSPDEVSWHQNAVGTERNILTLRANPETNPSTRYKPREAWDVKFSIHTNA